MLKRTSLFKKQETPVSDMNIFEKETFKENHKTFSGNGSVKLDTTGNIFLDDFASLGRYRQVRDIDSIFETMSKLWHQDPLLALKETVYIRTITRDTKIKNKKYKSIGQGLKNEFFGRMYWLAINHPDILYKNLPIFVAAGSWDDIFELMRLDLSYEHEDQYGILNYPKLLNFIYKGLNDEQQSSLVKKYLPTIKSASNCHTLRNECNNFIGKMIARELFTGYGDQATIYKMYRQYKSTGTAHDFQKLISQQKYDELNFNTIPGRVLGTMVKPRLTITKNNRKVASDGSCFLQRHGLMNKYMDWFDEQPTAKFTGFVYELFKDLNRQSTIAQKKTIDKQFEGLIQTAKGNAEFDSNMIVCLDTSGSMQSVAKGTNVSALEVARSIGLYFSEFLKGKFKNTFLEFDRETRIRQWKGNTPTEKFMTDMSGYCGNTDVLSVAHLLVNLLHHGYSEDEFPTGAILVSDGEFDANYGESVSSRVYYSHGKKQTFETTFDTFLNILRSGGFSEKFVQNFKLVLWDIPNGYYGREKPCFEGLADRENFYYLSGFDPSAISFLFAQNMPEKKVSTPKTPEELFEAAMNQDILNMLVL